VEIPIAVAMSPSCLQAWADWASIATFFLTLVTAVVGVIAYGRYLWERHDKSKRLESYLKNEKANKQDKGQRTATQITRDVGLTEDEIIQVSFRNPRVARRVKVDDQGLAERLLFEYNE
jgi:hypothetical protein